MSAAEEMEAEIYVLPAEMSNGNVHDRLVELHEQVMELQHETEAL